VQRGCGKQLHFSTPAAAVASAALAASRGAMMNEDKPCIIFLQFDAAADVSDVLKCVSSLYISALSQP
jgi:hypothetical protein